MSRVSWVRVTRLSWVSRVNKISCMSRMMSWVSGTYESEWCSKKFQDVKLRLHNAIYRFQIRTIM